MYEHVEITLNDNQSDEMAEVINVIHSRSPNTTIVIVAMISGVLVRPYTCSQQHLLKLLHTSLYIQIQRHLFKTDTLFSSVLYVELRLLRTVPKNLAQVSMLEG